MLRPVDLMSGLGDFWYKLILQAVDEDYPDFIHLPHTLISTASYRRWRNKEGQPSQWLYDLVMSYWTHSQGGGAVCKGWLMGMNQMSWLTNPKHLSFHALGYLLIYWSPRNFIDRMVGTPRHPLRLCCVALDGLDAATTTCALIDAGRKLHPKNNVLPYIMGVLCYQTGAIVRWAEARLRGKDMKCILAAPGSGVTKGVVIAFLWGLLRNSGPQRNRNLVALTTLAMFLDVIEDAFGFDAYANVHKPIVPVLQALQKSLSLGESKSKLT